MVSKGSGDSQNEVGTRRITTHTRHHTSLRPSVPGLVVAESEMPFNMLLACLIANACIASTALAAGPIVLSAGVPSNAPAPIPESFVSFSIEFSSFPDFAGEQSSYRTNDWY